MNTSEILTQRFYHWEERGRGWQAFGLPVELEPEFYPFFGHFLPSTGTGIDESKKPTILSSIVDLFKGKKEEPAEDNTFLTEIPPVKAYPDLNDEGISVYRVVLPKGEKIEIEDMEHLLLMLSYTSQPVSFEIVAASTAINIQLAVRESDEEHVVEQVRAYFPRAIVTKHNEAIELLLDDTQTCVIDFGLSDEFMRPLRMAHETEHDPYVGIFATLENLLAGESGIIQILFKGACNPWAESIMRSVTDNKGGSFFADAPDMVKLAEQKVSAPLYGVCIRVAGQARSNSRAVNIAENIGRAIVQLTTSHGNKLHMLPQDAYPVSDLMDDMLLRETHRLGMLLNSKELATIVHFPTPEIASAKIVRDQRKTKRAPESAQGHPFVLGVNTHHGEEIVVSVPASLRLRHTHIIGATGTGKSTMLLSMIGQDMQQGNGLAVLDPHGDLIEAILAYVPPERINDVILIDPSDGEYPVGFNILSAHSEIEKDILSSDLVAAFKRLSTSWGDQMNSVLANAILAFLESTEGGTLIDLRRFLIEKEYRSAYLKNVADPQITYYWRHEYPMLKSSSIGSILTRLDAFLRPKLIRNMVAQKIGLDFEHILDTKKILLVKLSQGLIGAENSFLLGTFFVSKMYQATMARQSKSKEHRSDYMLYIDEFQNFITPSMSYILSGARKYHLGLILAHQDMQQLQKYDTELASSVVVNAGTRICFRLGDTDAKRFAGGFSYFEAEDLENLHTGEAIARIEQPNFDFSLATIPLPDIQPEIAEATKEAVIFKSREKYGTPREIVEKSLEHLAKAIPEMNEPEPKKVVPQPAQPLKVEHQVLPVIPVEQPSLTIPTSKAETKHRYLQTLIKRLAESRGYVSKIEELTPDGKGRVDVSLERNGKRVACEVSVTTDETWEVHNVEKCLSAGYDMVIVCSNEARHLKRIQKQLNGKLTKEQLARVFTFEPDELGKFFDMQVVQENNSETVMKGYRVKTEYEVLTPEEAIKTHGSVMKTVTESIRRKKEIS